MELQLHDRVKMKKPHPCGCAIFEVTRLGVDYKLKCTGCEGETVRPGLPASGMFIINPPFTLKPALALALPQLVTHLGQDKNAAFTLESGG